MIRCCVVDAEEHFKFKVLQPDDYIHYERLDIKDLHQDIVSVKLIGTLFNKKFDTFLIHKFLLQRLNLNIRDYCIASLRFSIRYKVIIKGEKKEDIWSTGIFAPTKYVKLVN